MTSEFQWVPLSGKSLERFKEHLQDKLLNPKLGKNLDGIPDLISLRSLEQYCAHVMEGIARAVDETGELSKERMMAIRDGFDGQEIKPAKPIRPAGEEEPENIYARELNLPNSPDEQGNPQGDIAGYSISSTVPWNQTLAATAIIDAMTALDRLYYHYVALSSGQEDTIKQEMADRYRIKWDGDERIYTDHQLGGADKLLESQAELYLERLQTLGAPNRRQWPTDVFLQVLPDVIPDNIRRGLAKKHGLNPESDQHQSQALCNEMLVAVAKEKHLPLPANLQGKVK